jgi:peptidoglycan/xylan/chitin deacetylase (PgdA/CDA1 family)
LSTVFSTARLGRRQGWTFAAAVVALTVMALTAIALAVSWLWLQPGPAWAAPASVVYRGSSEEKQIALTFDDNTKVAPALATLRALEANKVPATLFVIGSAVESFPAINAEVIKGMQQGLFEVGDHSWSHPVLKGLSASALARQIGGGTDAFHEATGARTVPLFRPPYGSTDARVAAAAGAEGFRYVVLWDVDPRDWAGGSASSIASHVIDHAHNGAIVVMHLSGAHTAEAVHTIVSTLRARGYEFVTVSAMLKGDRTFLDVDEATEAGQAVARMAQQGLMSGYDGNYFGPTDAITRSQVAKVAVLVGGLHTAEVEAAPATVFADVPARHNSSGAVLAYPYDFVQEAAAAGLVVGSSGPDGTTLFRPNEAITRVQLAQILARMARDLRGYAPMEDLSGQIVSTQSPFADVPEYAAADVASVAALGLMSGYTGGDFRPWQDALREQVALAMSRFLDLPPAPPAD